MEIIKKYWKEGTIVILIVITAFFYFTKDKEKEITAEELEQKEIVTKIENLVKAQDEYNKLIEQQVAKANEEVEKLKVLEEAVATNVEIQKKEVVDLKNKKKVLNEKYKVNSPYDTTKLSKLLKLYTK